MRFLLLGKSNRIAIEVMQAVRSAHQVKCLVAGDEASLPLRWSAHCERHLLTDLRGSDDDRFVDWINRLAGQTPDITLIPFDCDGIRMANRVRSRISSPIVPTPDLATLDLLEDKWRFHEFCTKHSLSVPQTVLIGSKSELDIDGVVAKLGLPFVLKPTNESGSLGVQIIESRHQWEEQILNNPAYEYHPLIAQQYIDGADIDLSVLSIQGRLAAYAIQQTAGCQITFLKNSCLENVAEKICRDSACHGVMHIDARIEKQTGKVYLIESNPRFWASLTASAWCGLNFVAESAKHKPAAEGADEAYQLSAGTGYNRHPLLMPSLWLCLVSDKGERGRLLRAKVFDLYTLGILAWDLPLMAFRLARRCAARFRWPLRHRLIEAVVTRSQPLR